MNKGKEIIQVLLVDDDEDDYLIIRKMLLGITGSRFKLSWASSYEQAMPLIEKGCHDVYLIDYHLPKYNGLEILRQAIQLTNNSPLILLTGQNERKLENLAIDLGAADYLVKDEIIPALLERSIRYAIHRKQVEEQRLHEALYDSLTGLPNWNFFMKRLELAIKKAKEDRSRQYAVLLMDLDRFKGVNNSLGHRTGDQLLITVAQRLHKWLTPDMVLARFGGDEFTLLMDNILDPQEAQTMAEKVMKNLSGSLELDGNEIFTSASIGIALSKSDYERPEDILRDADTAMCRAKTQGKSRCEVFQDNMYNRAVEMFQLETDLRKAVERKEFVLHYQPIISMESGTLHGFEALVRWMHPKQGMIPPDKFIPLAEETGLMIPLGTWVLQEACEQMKVWHEKFPITKEMAISVNLSGVQFQDGNLIKKINDVLKETGLEAHHLKLEITESIIMEHEKSVHALLHELKANHIKLSIDDFGTGYSSLSFLHNFPFNTLKVDRSFINDMGHDIQNLEIVRTIIMLAHNLGMDVCAEGVENREQLVQLKALRCERAQGYFFSKPMGVEHVETFLQDNPHW